MKDIRKASLASRVLSLKGSTKRSFATAVAVGLGALVTIGAGACSSESTPQAPSGAPAPSAPSPAGTASSAAASNGRPRLDPLKIGNGVWQALPGNTNPKALPINSTGRIANEFVIEHMQLVLQRSPEEETTLKTLIDAMHDKASPSYQHWLSATEFGNQYGVAPADIAVITKWLESYGMTIDHVPPSRMFIEFSGTAEQVSRAFHTEIHELLVNGERHFANMNDPEIPAELAKTVVGVHALHDFMPHPTKKDRGLVRRDATSGGWNVTKPSPDEAIPFGGQCTVNSDCASNSCNVAAGLCNCTTAAQCSATHSGAAAQCDATAKTCVQCQTNADCVGPGTCNTTTHACAQTIEAVTPADFATIYNLNPLFAEGITGAGQTVVVIEDTLIQNVSDVATFKTAFGLTSYGGTFSQVTPTGSATCGNAGVNGAEGEAALDAEWAAASAPGAAIKLAACADTTTVFGGLIALQNLINGASPPPVVSISYGECESANGATANQSYVNTYQQAAALGVSVFVSSGDEGAASCDANKAVSKKGIAVSGFASTPYNVAVGGTDFMDYYASQHGGPPESTYWNAANTSTFGNALSYVPEIPWNNSCASQAIYTTPSITLGSYTQAYGATGFCNSTLGKNFQTTGSGSGGPSSFSAQPAWQTGVVGLPTKSGGMRAIPDVSLFAANGVFGHFLLYCLTDTAQGGGPCVYTSTADSFALAAGGTSFASPALAGIQALVDQKMGGAQGNPNYTYYKLAAAEQGIRGSTRCNASQVSGALPTSECIFNDVTFGDIAVNCTGTKNCFGSTGTTVDGVLSTSNTTLSPAYAAGTGWDYATGLGTVNAYNLVTAWSK